MKLVLVSIAAASVFVSCKGLSSASDRGLSIVPDSAVYHLHPAPGGYAINITATVINETDSEIFIAATCGSWFLARADASDKTQLLLGSYGCMGGALEKPTPVARGQKYSRSFRLSGATSPFAGQRITIVNNIGTLVFGYVLADSTGRPRGRLSSTPFKVLPAVYDSLVQPSSVLTLSDRRTVEVIGLRRWTIGMLQDSLAKYAPSDSLQSHACAAVLRYKLHFADASSTTFSFGGDTPNAIVVSVREPQDSARVHYREMQYDTLPARKDWRPIVNVYREHPNVFWPELKSRVSFSYPKPQYRTRGDSSVAREFALAVSSFSHEADRKAAVNALASDSNMYDRIAAVVVLTNFLHRDDTWWALVDALREVEGPVKAVAAEVMLSSSRNVAKKVDWTPRAASIHAILDGTSLFVLDDLIQVLTHTGVSPRDAADMIGNGGGQMLLAYLGSKNRVLAGNSRSLLTALNGFDLGPEQEPWRAWMATQNVVGR